MEGYVRPSVRPCKYLNPKTTCWIWIEFRMRGLNTISLLILISVQFVHNMDAFILYL